MKTNYWQELFVVAVSVENLLFPVISKLFRLFPAASKIGRVQSYLSTAVLWGGYGQ